MIDTKTKIKFVLILAALLCNLACQNQAVNSQNSNETLSQITPETLETPGLQTQSNDEKAISIEGVVAERESLKFEGYEVKKFLTKKKFDNDSPIADIADAVLQKNGKTLFRFEGVYYPNGNQIEFGLFSFLDSKTKQLIIYETTNRYGRVWIVSLSPKPKILFDSNDWGDFREFVYFDDIDEDGKYEISMQTEVTLSFEDKPIAHINIPQIGYIFKYDNKKGRFLPANHKFQNLYLEKIDERISKVKSQDSSSGFDEYAIKDFIDIFLIYIYAGKENEAWEFFDKEYNLKDKEIRKEKIKVILNKDPIYKSIKNELSRK